MTLTSAERARRPYANTDANTNANANDPAGGGPRPPGLGDLARLPLEPRNARALDRLCAEMASGSAAWRQRKRVEAHGLLALSQIAPRLVIRHLDLRTELMTMIELSDTPVPCMSPGSNDLRIEVGALVTIQYPQEILFKPLPGTQPIRVLEPRNVFHSNVGPQGERVPALCLGDNVPRGLPLREMVLSIYAALTLQAISLDNLDPAGVLNGDAARWWQANAQRIPLTAEPFLRGRAPGPLANEGIDGEGRS